MDRQALIEQCERARRACEAVSAAREALQSTCAQTAALLAAPRRIPSLGPCIDTALPPADTSIQAPVVAVELTEHELEMDVLRMMHTLLDGFPPQMPVKIVKALTARTMVVVVARLQRARIARTA